MAPFYPGHAGGEYRGITPYPSRNACNSAARNADPFSTFRISVAPWSANRQRSAARVTSAVKAGSACQASMQPLAKSRTASTYG